MANPEMEKLLGELQAAQIHVDTGQEVARRLTKASMAVRGALPGYAEEIAPLGGPMYTGINLDDYMLLAHGTDVYVGGDDAREHQAGLQDYIDGAVGQRLFVHSADKQRHYIDTGTITGPSGYVLSTSDRLFVPRAPEHPGSHLVREYARPMFTVPIAGYLGGVFDASGLFPSRPTSGLFKSVPAGELAVTGWCELGERPIHAVVPNIAVGPDIDGLVEELSSKHPFLVGSLQEAWQSVLSGDFPEPPAPIARRKSGA